MKGKRDMQNGKTEKSTKTKYFGIFFLGSVLFLYLFLFFLEPENILKSLNASGGLLIQIFPVLLLIIFLMGVVNYFVNPKTVSKYVGKGSGVRGWFIAVSTGILSHGPIYVWYPLLRDLQDQGMRSGLIAVFLYNRAIKIPLLPLMVFYFGMIFVVVLTVYMIVASIIEGRIIEMIERRI